MEQANIQPSFEIERFLEKFERIKRAYIALIMETGARHPEKSNIRIRDIEENEGLKEDSQDELF